MIENCGTNDEMLACIIKGLSQQRKVFKISLRNIEIGVKAAQEITKILAKAIPFNLEDLKLENCFASPEAISIIL